MEKSLLCEKIPIKSNFKVVTNLVFLFLHSALLVYRIRTLADHGFAWLLAFLCESWFAFERVLSVATTWTPAKYETYPQNLLQTRNSSELPGVDMFITTADPTVEQPVLTMNTVLSLLAVDYPVDKLACYLSDDGCSPLILYSLIETTEFAHLWVPFCKKFNVQLRAPFRFFALEAAAACTDQSPEFLLERKNMKDKYDRLVQKIEEAANGFVEIENVGEFLPFANTQKNDHPTIIKVIWENKERDPESLPDVIYVCREKRPKYPHHYKAGAMNVLTRVSGLMTNNPFLLNVDCDMFVNNPGIVLQAMCPVLDLKPEDCAFVQFPQDFYDIPKDDPFGNQMTAGFAIFGHAMNGIQGPPYVGTGCFHRRKLIYGFFSDTKEKCDGLSLEVMKKSLGSCMEFLGSVSQILSQSQDHDVKPQDYLSTALQASMDVARFDYEKGSSWGKQVGWGYESVTEDVLTGLKIHAAGWKSVMLMPNQPGFLGTTPTTAPESFSQRKRWAAGLLQVLLSRYSPVMLCCTSKLEFRECLAYTSILIWTVNAIPNLCYSVLPAYCLITGSRFLPKATEPAIIIFAALFTIDKVLGLMFFLRYGQSARTWWSNTRMAMINPPTSCLFGIISCIVKALGISDIPFDTTPKRQSRREEEEDGHGDNVARFTFDESPIFVTGTTFMLLHLVALATGLLGRKANVVGFGEFLCSVWVVLCFWPFVRGIFGERKYGIPTRTLFMSAFFAMIIVKSFG